MKTGRRASPGRLRGVGRKGFARGRRGKSEKTRHVRASGEDDAALAWPDVLEPGADAGLARSRSRSRSRTPVEVYLPTTILKVSKIEVERDEAGRRKSTSPKGGLEKGDPTKIKHLKSIFRSLKSDYLFRNPASRIPLWGTVSKS